MEESGFDLGEIVIEDDALKKVIREYTYEAGVRNLEREIGRLCRKVARLKSEKKKVPATIGLKMIEKYLGPPQFFMTEAERQDEIGVATAIAWTENGGEIMPVEVLILEGKGNLQITGQVGDVMQESAQAALSYLKSKSTLLKLEPQLFEEVDVHVHIPEGAIPKDGPSAGITIATALFSAFSERRVFKEIGMTGEITLRGNILPVGGVREKILAAHRSGLKTILLPEKNIKDLVEVPKKVLDELHIKFVKHMDEVIKLALHTEQERSNPALRRDKKKQEKSQKKRK
jgi:ATP-dependent Lon protease